jgi:chaperonin GroES
MKVRPYGGFVFVEVEKAAETTASGLLYVPETNRKATHRGTVLGVGSGRVEEDGVFRTIDVKVGDRIAYDRMGVHDVPDMPDHVLVSSAYVLGVIE